MLDALYSGCSALAAGVKIVAEVLKTAMHMNYEFVVLVVSALTVTVNTTALVYGKIKCFVLVIAVYLGDVIREVYVSFASLLNLLSSLIIAFGRFIQTYYAIISTVCLICAHKIANAILSIKDFIMDMYDFMSTAADYSANLVINLLSGIAYTITAIGSFCVNFVTGVWQGLGFVLSSVALFPVHCVEFIEDSWTKLTTAVADIILATTKETYLGIVVLCLVYLTLSNTVRYMYCRGLSLFPRRFTRTRRARSNQFYWQIDPGFESDFEDTLGLDSEDRRYMPAGRNGQNHDSDDEDSDREDADSSDSDNSDDVSDDDNDSDEYTVITEESDSDESIISQTFSTGSSDHEIEVQLPPVDERYSLRSRSSTPSRIPKSMSSEEEFKREMERERDKRKCVVCQDQIKSVLVLPCRHMCMCVLCANQIVRSRLAGRRVCPLCRTRITKVMNIYV